MRRSRVIFVHIPKSGGTAVKESLGGRYAPRDHVPWFIYQKADPGKFSAYFKFSVIRNPVGRLRSAYKYLLRGGNQVDDLPLARHLLQFAPTFERFVLEYLSEERVFSNPMFWPQWFFLCDEFDRIKVDFVARQESLDQDWNIILRELSTKRKSVLSYKKLGIENASPSGEVRFTVDEPIRMKIRALYRKDFDIFGYE